MSKKKVRFNAIKTIRRIPKIDCPKKNRPRLKKILLSPGEKKADSKYVYRRKKLKKICPDDYQQIYKTERGFDCCRKKRGRPKSKTPTVIELRKMCKRQGIKGYSRLRKKQLEKKCL